MLINDAIGVLVTGGDLSEEEAFQSLTALIEGKATDSQIASFLTALRMKGENEEEITGFARAIRAKAIPVNPKVEGLVDTCGTGGDMTGTFNISTTAAFVVSACGLPVAKHGNRSVSSKSGSADLLESLGIEINLSAQSVEHCIEETGIGFLFAPFFHSAMKHVSRARKEMAIRTVFNILGPLVNPAGAYCQLMGVYDPHLTEMIGAVLLRLGVEKALVVHGAGAMDEISTLGPTRATEVRDGKIKTYNILPQDYDFAPANAADLLGGDPDTNAALTKDILQGTPGPKTDIVILNAAAALYIAGKANDIAAGVTMAQTALDSGQAWEKLEQLRNCSLLLSREEKGVSGSA